MMKFKYFSMVLCLASVSAAHAGLTNINNRGAQILLRFKIIHPPVQVL